MLRDNIWTLNITERTGSRAKSISSQSLTPVTVHPPTTTRPHLQTSLNSNTDWGPNVQIPEPCVEQFLFKPPQKPCLK